MSEMLEAVLSDLEKSEKLNVILYEELEKREKAYTASLQQIVSSLNSSEIDENSLQKSIEQEPLPKQLGIVENSLQTIQHYFNNYQKEGLSFQENLKVLYEQFQKLESGQQDLEKNLNLLIRKLT